MNYMPDAHWIIKVNSETGQVYWSGGCEGDKDGFDFDDKEPLTLDPRHFPRGYRIIGETCIGEDRPKKGIIDDGFGNQWSSYCKKCGRRSMVVIRPGKVQCSYCG